MLSVQVKVATVEDYDLSQLPEPTGYRILVAVPEIEEKVGSIILASSTKETSQSVGIVGLVLKVGPLAYADDAKFNGQAWCKVGDWVLLRSHSGTPIKVGDKEFRIINDDTPEATVKDPNSVKRR